MNNKEGACLEKFPYKTRGQPNYWDVTKIKHLENINGRFSVIHLNTYDKSVDILLKKFNFPEGSMRTKKAFVQLSLSASFFDEVLDTDIETLYSRDSRLYSLEDFNMKQTWKN